MTFSLSQRLFAEGLGTAFLLAIVVGSGIMGETLSSDDAIALLGNTIATGAGLVVLILIFGPVSGAHFNPAVTLSFLLQKQITPRDAGLYIIVQIICGFLGVMAVHFIFGLDIIQTSLKDRSGLSQAMSEGIATVALLLTIIGTVKFKPDATPYAVGLIITAGYWYTSSTSFANPAVTLARAASNTFAGIAPSSAPAFILAQIMGAVIATGIGVWLFTPRGQALSAAVKTS